MTSVGAALKDAAAKLTEAGVDNPRLDARLLLAAALQVDAAYLFSHPEQDLDSEQNQAFAALLRRRCGREPIAQILGRREFWSLDFQVTADVLAPRPDSETLVEAVLDQIADRNRALSLLDLGTGSGCLLLALLSELPKASGIGVDRSSAALKVAAANAERLGLAGRARFVLSDWCAAIDGRFDVILANPPYIPTADIAGLEPEVAQFEPQAALDGGADGLDDYRVLAPLMADHLVAGGIAAFEVGVGQAGAVAELLQAAGLVVREIRRDLGAIDRVVIAGL